MFKRVTIGKKKSYLTVNHHDACLRPAYESYDPYINENDFKERITNYLRSDKVIRGREKAPPSSVLYSVIQLRVYV